MPQQRILTVAAAALCALAEPTLAQGALKPLEAVVVNPVSRPVPVTVIEPATPAKPQVVCRLGLPQGFGGSPITRISAAPPLSDALFCPAGVSRIDVQRIVLESAVPQHQVMLALGTPQMGPPPVERMIGAVSDGSPDLSLAHPVRIDLTSAEYIHMRQICSSGMASVSVECGGWAYLIGTPVSN
jgi:hypothetical protein